MLITLSWSFRRHSGAKQNVPPSTVHSLLSRQFSRMAGEWKAAAASAVSHNWSATKQLERSLKSSTHRGLIRVFFVRPFILSVNHVETCNSRSQRYQRWCVLWTISVAFTDRRFQFHLELGVALVQPPWKSLHHLSLPSPPHLHILVNNIRSRICEGRVRKLLTL